MYLGHIEYRQHRMHLIESLCTICTTTKKNKRKNAKMKTQFTEVSFVLYVRQLIELYLFIFCMSLNMKKSYCLVDSIISICIHNKTYKYKISSQYTR